MHEARGAWRGPGVTHADAATSRPRTLQKLAILGSALALIPVTWLAPGDTAYAATTAYSPVDPTLMAGQTWMIKDDDLAIIGGIGSYEWVGCGESTAPGTANNFTPCQPGEDPIYTNYDTFVNDINDGTLSSGDTVIFDDENWPLTPAWERVDQVQYQTEAIQAANANGITLISTPFAVSRRALVKEEVAAAEAGASVVEIQAQATDNNPRVYAKFVAGAVKAIRRANPNIMILAGLATDANGVPASANALYESYQAVKQDVASFWLNADTRTNGKGCSPKGCPKVALQFLADLGVTGSQG